MTGAADAGERGAAALRRALDTDDADALETAIALLCRTCTSGVIDGRGPRRPRVSVTPSSALGSSAVTGERTGPPGTLDGPLREDALDVLRDAFGGQLTELRWNAVAEAEAALAAALRAGDRDAARAAVDDLELTGAVRATRAGGPNPRAVPVPEPLNDVVNELIQTIDGPPSPTGELRAAGP